MVFIAGTLKGPESEELKALLRDGQLLKIAFDIDGTLAMIDKPMIGMYNELKGTSYTENDMTDWNFKLIGATYREMMNIYVDLWKNHYAEIKFAGDAKQIKELAKYYAIDIVTARDTDDSKPTGDTAKELSEWIGMHQLSGIPIRIVSPNTNKANLDYQIYVDDSPRLAEKVVGKEGKVLFLVHHPFNASIHEDGQKIIRVADAKEATRILINEARKESKITRI